MHRVILHQGFDASERTNARERELCPQVRNRRFAATAATPVYGLQPRLWSGLFNGNYNTANSMLVRGYDTRPWYRRRASLPAICILRRCMNRRPDETSLNFRVIDIVLWYRVCLCVHACVWMSILIDSRVPTRSVSRQRRFIALSFVIVINVVWRNLEKRRATSRRFDL